MVGRFSNKEALVEFLTMVRLKERKLRWVLQQKGKKNKELAYLCGIKVRRFQQLKSEYKRTGVIPKLNPKRRPKTGLSLEDKALIDKTVEESKLTGAVTIRLYIDKYYHKKLPYTKVHTHLLATGISRPDEKKQRQRKYCRYQRKHSFSLGHLDYHESKVFPGKQVIVWEDDASRAILAGRESNNATAELAINVVKEAKKKAWDEYSAFLLELNTDKGSQFYANKKDKTGEKALARFEKFLEKQGIHHIPSRRNHPQTNGKEERWFRTYEEKRGQFKTFKDFINWYNNRIHLGLNRKTGTTPDEAIINKLRPENILGLYARRLNQL